MNNQGTYLGLHEAWGEILLHPRWSLKFGRQEIILDNHRIFGNVNWTAQARSHDALMLKYKNNNLRIQVAGAYNQDNASLQNTIASQGSYKSFQYIWINNQFKERFNTSILILNNGKEQLDSTTNLNQPIEAIYKDNYSQTIGTRVEFEQNKIGANGSIYFQTGKLGNRNEVYSDVKGKYDKKVKAMEIAVEFSYQATKKILFATGYEYLSGQSQSDTSYNYRTTLHSFNPLYGTNHKFNGTMDYFFVGNHTESVGLQDLYLKAKYKSDKLWLMANVHIFLSAADVLDQFKINTDNDLAMANTGSITAVNQLQTMSPYLGVEFDFSMGFNLSENVVIKAGYSRLFASETLAYLKGVVTPQGQGEISKNNNWMWAMIIMKPNFIEKMKSLANND